VSAQLIVYLAASPFTSIGTANVTITTSWQRFTVTTSAATAATYNLQVNNIGAGTVYAWGAQLEAGAFPTSYIPTVASQATRAADAASMTGTNFSSWWRQDEGTFYAETNAAFAGSFRNILEGAVASDYRDFSMSLDGRRVAFTNRQVSTSNDVLSPTDSLTAGAFSKFAGSFSASATDLSYNGLLATQKGNAALRAGPVDRLWIGSRLGSAIFLNGTIARIAFYPRRLTNAELQGITA
jgi:hypothetical protein